MSVPRFWLYGLGRGNETKWDGWLMDRDGLVQINGGPGRMVDRDGSGQKDGGPEDGIRSGLYM